MIVLNATKQVKSLMTDRGDFINIEPGSESRLVIATRNMIIGAMKLGSPMEIGIIISGSYEFEIAKSITGSTPYLYTDVDEAKAKLLDPNIDYKQNINADKINYQSQEQIKEMTVEMEGLKSTIQELKNKLKTATESDESARVESERKYKDLEGKFIKVQEERDRIKSQLAESQDQVSNLTGNLNSIRKEYEDTKGYYAETQKVVDKLTAELKTAKDELASCKSESDEIDVTKSKEYIDLASEVSSLKDSLKEASETIDNMKLRFNACCEKFNITLDENGEWIQLPSDEIE